MIRGAIAFGLVLRIDDSYTNRDVIVTTSLSLVVFTTVVFGSTVGLLRDCVFTKKPEEHQPKYVEVGGSKAENPNKEPLLDKSSGASSVDLSPVEDHYGEHVHPNMTKEE